MTLGTVMFFLFFCVTKPFPMFFLLFIFYACDVLVLVRHVLVLVRHVLAIICVGMFTSAVYSVDVHVDSSKCVQITRHLALGKCRVGLCIVMLPCCF